MTAEEVRDLLVICDRTIGYSLRTELDAYTYLKYLWNVITFFIAQGGKKEEIFEQTETAKEEIAASETAANPQVSSMQCGYKEYGKSACDSNRNWR